MKILESHFIDYIQNSEKSMLHYNHKISSINTMKNIIIYGPPGIGKYAFTLNMIKSLSFSGLKYEKKNYTYI